MVSSVQRSISGCLASMLALAINRRSALTSLTVGATLICAMAAAELPLLMMASTLGAHSLGRAMLRAFGEEGAGFSHALAATCRMAMSHSDRLLRLAGMKTENHRTILLSLNAACSVLKSLGRWLRAAVLLWPLLACSAPDTGPQVRDGVPGVLVSAGRHLYLHCQGVGSPTVVLEAGMAGWSTDWALVQGPLAAHTRTCAYDRAGYGASDAVAPGQRPTPQDDLQHLLDTNALAGPVVLVGHSLGGLLVADYARRHPERVAALVLVDAVHRLQDVDDHPAVHSGEYAHQRTTLAAMTRWAVWLAPTGVLRLTGNSASLVASRLPEPARSQALASAWSRAAYVAMRDENVAFDGWLAQARQAGPLPRVPAVVLSSTRAQDFPPGFDSPAMQSLWAWRQTQLAQELGVRAQPIADSGHYIHVDQAPQVVHAVLQVLQQARANLAHNPAILSRTP